MRTLLVLSLLFSRDLVYSQVKICSWNIENIGGSKSKENLEYIASIIRDFDVIAIQEVVPSASGVASIVNLTAILNSNKGHWKYLVSQPTTGSSYKTERYAFIWNTYTVNHKGKAWLEQKFQQEIDREPFYCTFLYKGKDFTLSNFHAITKNMQPETEIKYFKFLPNQYLTHNLIFLGDFNCPETHTVFIPLKKSGYRSVFQKQKTSLKRECKDSECLASEFDNIFFDSLKVEVQKSGVIHFYKDFPSMKKTREISDHIPIWVEFKLK
ncbi:endonuclease/exonuclease/phosphatase family protein [Flavobacterium agrisoli]|uniref:endonuclease/exonuclease/phosphatase family protein n=1 Tax=Flavobacterium agrisoli TaxID=2793066 RepID=UPI001F2B9F82|nr:endonuclease/exonuclease/phosphatase family protein [Flavobacterium agrisoli]